MDNMKVAADIKIGEQVLHLKVGFYHPWAQHDHQAVDDKGEQSQGQQVDGQREQLDQRLDACVDKPEHDGNNHGPPPGIDGHAVKGIGGNEDRQRREK